ncbi:serine hydrolase domain-containing protein [Steroidobacter sp.]|uniref:serine hydrolase domain-containing protein n=1 Tax=Steroidobacter sp. TaxID=1978227 RepID=UPI001A58C0E7|nr:serine hydrolase domain-containing protein [Steroidobacter sp.]MBL8267497.1 beta-lactamase family protein [Steroidobacter sp.]
MSMHRAMIVSLAACGLLVVAQQGRAADSFDDVRAAIRKEIDGGVASVAVAVAQNGKIVWEQGFGIANKETGRQADPSTMYVLASVSKPITSTGMMRLVDGGRMQLDAPINDYLGDAKLVAIVGDIRDATVRRIANHSSGLPEHAMSFHLDEPYSAPPADQTIRRYGHIVAPPGTRWKYSNFGYGVLETAIARTSGQSFGDYMREEVFLPLGMKRSSAYPQRPVDDNVAARYRRDGSRITDYNGDFVGYGGIYSSAHDLARFGMFHLKNKVSGSKRLFSDARVDELHAASYDSGWWGVYGLGWFRSTSSEQQLMVWHAGASYGTRAFLGLLPDRNVAIAVVSNSDTESIETIRSALLAKFGYQEQLWSAKDRSSPNEPAPSFSEQLRGEWTGLVHTYRGNVPLVINVGADGAVDAKLGLGPVARIANARVKDLSISAELPGSIDTDDARRRRNALQLTVNLYGERLVGDLGTKVPWPREKVAGDFVSHWVELRRSGSSAGATL